MDRHVLSDEQWGKIGPVLPGKAGDRGRSAVDNRMFVEAALWIAGTGAPWRDLPDSFGHWNSNFRRFRRWAVNGVFDMLFDRLSGFEYAMIDGTILRVHQQGTGARGDSLSGDRPLTWWPDNQDRCTAGRSRESRQIHSAAVPEHDLVGVKPLIHDVEFQMFLGDKALDADWLRAELDERGLSP